MNTKPLNRATPNEHKIFNAMKGAMDTVMNKPLNQKESETMKPIKFKQYMFPNGRAVEVIIDRPEPIADRASVLEDQGYSLEIENKDGQIWMSCVNHETEKAFDEVVLNGPEVPVMVDKMINEAFESLEVVKHD